jgi:hypothetical protein
MTQRTISTGMMLVAAFALTVRTQAQATNGDGKQLMMRQERIMENFKASLKSEYRGIVEGTMYNIIIYKKYYPQLDYTDLLNVLNQYSLTNDDVALRYQAQLASLYLTHTNTITIEPVEHPSEHEYIFRQIADQLESKFLVAR